jgi:stalled ribosome rescue protein Dom34
MTSRSNDSEPRKAQRYGIKVGVWLDHRQAVVVLVSDTGQEIKKVKSGAERTGAGARSSPKYTPNDFIAEDRRDRKVAGDRKKFYDDVVARLLGAKAILILGPGEAKGEFAKHLQSKRLGGVTVEVTTADKMTDRQIAAKAVEHFKKGPAAKTVVRKAPAKKAAKPAAKKQPQKSRK